jgi:hypothetical protein
MSQSMKVTCTPFSSNYWHMLQCMLAMCIPFSSKQTQPSLNLSHCLTLFSVSPPFLLPFFFSLSGSPSLSLLTLLSLSPSSLSWSFSPPPISSTEHHYTHFSLCSRIINHKTQISISQIFILHVWFLPWIGPLDGNKLRWKYWSHFSSIFSIRWISIYFVLFLILFEKICDEGVQEHDGQ